MSKYVVVDENTGKRLSEVFKGPEAKSLAESAASNLNRSLTESGNPQGQKPVAKELLEG